MERAVSGGLASGSLPPPAASVLADHGLDPCLVIQVPAHGFANSQLEGVSGSPTQIALEFRSIDGITTIMPRTVFDEGDQFASAAAELRSKFIDEIGDQFDDADVGPFVMAANVIGLAIGSTGQDAPKSLGMIAHVKPIPHIHAVAVDRDLGPCCRWRDL